MAQKSKTRETIESLIIAIVIALLVRSFVVQAFKIPSASMVPTLLIGDHLLVNRLAYVMKVPITDSVIMNLGEPKRGDVVVFRYPVDRSKDFIKRVIAVGGDTLEIKNKVIYVNGRKTDDVHAHFADDMIIPRGIAPRDFYGPITVPKGSYFCMGDNRDRSLDSRFWGFVKHEDLVGKALIIYFSFDSKPDDILHLIRWDRFAKLIH